MKNAKASESSDLTASTTIQESGKHRRRKYLRLLVLLPVLLIVFAGSVYVYYLYRYENEVAVKQRYVDSWDDLTVQTAVLGEQRIDTVTPDISPAPNAIVKDPSSVTQYVEPRPAALKDVDGKNDPIIKIEPIDPNVENILLIGIDGGDGLNIGHRSDTMLIVSIDKVQKTVKLTSIMRDIWAYFPNKDSWNKINAAYAFGGPGQTVNIVNYNFDLDIQKYVVTDFEGFRSIVNTFGGVSITVTDKEATQISGLSTGGTYLLDGEQTLSYARIRYIDSDFARVLRQRTVLLSIFSTLREQTKMTQLRAANDSIAFMRSNIDTAEVTGRLYDLALQVDASIEQCTLPESGMYTIHNSGTWYMDVDWKDQVASLHEFIYGNT